MSDIVETYECPLCKGQGYVLRNQFEMNHLLDKIQKLVDMGPPSQNPHRGVAAYDLLAEVLEVFGEGKA